MRRMLTVAASSWEMSRLMKSGAKRAERPAIYDGLSEKPKATVFTAAAKLAVGSIYCFCTPFGAEMAEFRGPRGPRLVDSGKTFLKIARYGSCGIG
jgi:hypothetical protein